MIAIPLTKNFSWRSPPFLTIFLILANIFIFITVQNDDDYYWSEARSFYVDSGLGALEIDIYKAFLENDGKELLPEQTSEPDLRRGDRDEDEDVKMYLQMRRDTVFQKQLKAGKILAEGDPRISRWQALHAEYEEALEKVATFKYGFRPDQPRPFTWLSCMFLHGGWGHLIGNMIFLWLIGALIEYGCRHVVFPIIYLLGGMGGTALFLLLNPDSGIPLVGASGAIAGIMGGFTVLYGLKKVRIFLNLGFYFNYLKFPALILLPVWMASELLQMVTNSFSPVAYAAHLGGLGVGALLALGARFTPGCLDESAFQAAEDNRVATLLEQALNHMGKLEFDQAREILVQALECEPDNILILQHLYTIDQYKPNEGDFHRTTARMIELLSKSPDSYEKACSVFEDYLQKAKPPRLSAETYFKISTIYISMGKLIEAQRLLFALLKKGAQSSSLPMAIFKLAQGFQKADQTAEWKRCLNILRKHFPVTHEAQVASRLLEESS